MTNKEILHADMLDILFEHRNKLYGAYALRRTYNSRLIKALVSSLLLMSLLILATSLKGKKKNTNQPGDKEGVILTHYSLPEPETKEPEPEKKQHAAEPEFKQRDFRTIQIVSDEKVKKEIVSFDDLIDARIGNRDIEGLSDNRTKIIQPAVSEGGAKETEKNEEGKQAPAGPTFAPSFPGGPEALANFLRNNLNTPGDLEPGQKVTVLIKFLVSTDGTISGYEIVQSGGKAYDKEVIRVIKKMPKWNPGKQNGHLISMHFTQPVIFIGLED